ncbi:tetratricopeptide repeat protein [Candidatus Albibeggiatoa sp. nov. NOAA]|uniref:tetratricopeptide repeat protein n=1 Tax=Candidatus Albibeggiatoa sp. nov. NOAA TaxID=3162724 RepID=UPI0032F33503|nr:tetratricopeptide repeat protein [Thiotrichaceae bacterium]
MNKKFQRAVEYYQKGDLQKSANLCQQILKKSPHDLEALNLLGVLAIQTKQIDQAQVIFQQMLKIKPEARSYSNLGYVLEKSSQFEQAAAMYQQAIKLDNKNYDLYINFINALTKAGRSTDVIKVGQQALALKPSAKVYAELGIAYYQLQQTEAAEQAFRQAIKLSPKNAEYHSKLGLVLSYHKTEQGYQEAEQLFKYSIQLQTHNPISYYYLGVNYLFQRQFTKAEHHFHQAVMQKSDLIDARFSLAVTQHRMQNIESKQTFKAVIQYYQDQLQQKLPFASLLNTLKRLATSHVFLNQLDKAEQYFRELEKIVKDNPEKGTTNYQLMAATCFSPDFYQNILNADFPQNTQVAIQKLAKFDYVVTASCDANYFSKYAKNFVNSLLQNNHEAIHLHLHIMNPIDEVLSEAQNFLSQQNIASYCVTTEQVVLQDAKLLKTYYTFGRFLNMAQWLETYQKPIISLDIDAIVEKPLSYLIDAIPEADMGVRSRQITSWEEFVANVMVIKSNPETIAYFDVVRRYLLHFVEKSYLVWGVDELALTAAHHLRQYYEKQSPKLQFINTEVEEVLWQLGHKNVEKLEEQRFTQYSDETT